MATLDHEQRSNYVIRWPHGSEQFHLQLLKDQCDPSEVIYPRYLTLLGRKNRKRPPSGEPTAIMDSPGSSPDLKRHCPESPSPSRSLMIYLTLWKLPPFTYQFVKEVFLQRNAIGPENQQPSLMWTKPKEDWSPSLLKYFSNASHKMSFTLEGVLLVKLSKVEGGTVEIPLAIGERGEHQLLVSNCTLLLLGPTLHEVTIQMPDQQRTLSFEASGFTERVLDLSAMVRNNHPCFITTRSSMRLTFNEASPGYLALRSEGEHCRFELNSCYLEYWLPKGGTPFLPYSFSIENVGYLKRLEEMALK